MASLINNSKICVVFKIAQDFFIRNDVIAYIPNIVSLVTLHLYKTLSSSHNRQLDARKLCKSNDRFGFSSIMRGSFKNIAFVSVVSRLKVIRYPWWITLFDTRIFCRARRFARQRRLAHFETAKKRVSPVCESPA